MPISNKLVGQTTRSFEHTVDARWIMAYAAGLDDCNPRYMDTAAGAVIAHPVFPVCLEWPVLLTSRELAGSEEATAEESARSVHAAHDLHIFKPITAGEVYRTQAKVVGLKAIRPGAAQTTRVDTFDAEGELVCRTWQLSIFRDAAISGEPRISDQAPELPAPGQGEAISQRFSIAVREGLANVYTECAHIYNPIHSDRAFALAAGLPDIILHGTATLALAITRLVNEFLQGNPVRITRLGCRFTGMVLMPSELSLEVSRLGNEYLEFNISNAEGQPILSQGFVCFKSS